MLYLLFELGGDVGETSASTAGRYALEANRVVEVVPLLSLTKIPQAPKGVAGLFVYRGRAVPAVDLCELTIGSRARERLSTRIIIIDYSEASDRNQLLGLIVERATGMMRRDARDFVDTGLKPVGAPFLGPVLIDDRGVIQLLHTQKLLPENVRDLVFAPSVVWPSPPSPCEPMVRGVEGGEGETFTEASHAPD